MSFLPILLGLLTAFCWGTSDYLSRSQSARIGHYSTVVYMHVMTLAFLLLLLPVLSPSITLVPSAAGVLIVSGLLNFLAFLYLYRAFHRGVVSVVAPIAYTYPAVTSVASVLVLGVVLAPNRAASIGFIMVGVLLLSTRFSELKAYTRGKASSGIAAGAGSAMASSVLFGLVYVGVGYATPTAGYVLPAVVLRGAGALTGFLAAPVIGERIWPGRTSFSPTMVLMGALEAIGFLSFNYGLFLGVDALPAVAALSGMGGAVAASYGMVFLKERLERNQILGACMAIAGVFLLLYLGA